MILSKSVPTISVVIPAYNQSRYLAAAVQSVLDQTEQDFEIIIVDDGSTDQTRQVAASFDDPRLRYIYQENAGLSAARNTGIRNSSGNYLTFLDSDDLFTPRKLELLAGRLDDEPELGFAAGKAILIDQNGNPLGKTFDQPPPDDLSDLLDWNPFHVSSVMIRREWQEQAGLFDESLRAYEDWDMWLRLARLGCRMDWVAEPVSYYRFHTGQMTRDRERMTTATFAVLSKTFADPSLPQNWQAKKDLAYSSAYLRKAIQAYRAEEFPEASAALARAVELDPRLAANQGQRLSDRLSAMADSPKVTDKLEFLEMIYHHLPPELSGLAQERNTHLAKAAVELGFAAFQQGELSEARTYLWKAIRCRPAWLANSGVRSILFKSFVRMESKPTQPVPHQ